MRICKVSKRINRLKITLQFQEYSAATLIVNKNLLWVILGIADLEIHSLWQVLWAEHMNEYLTTVWMFWGKDLIDLVLAIISVAVNFMFCDGLMFEVLLCCYSFPVLIRSYFSEPNHRHTLIKGLYVQAIKMCSCSCIIIQPCALSKHCSLTRGFVLSSLDSNIS